jgi:hypothetical protein
MPEKPLLNHTTVIAAEKTLGEIMGLLAGAGARKLQVEYDDSGQPSGLSFLIQTKIGERGFTLPARVDAVHRVLEQQYKRGKVQRRFTTRDQAARVTWRILRDWLDAQLALIQADMASLEEVMFAHMIQGPEDKTIYQLMVQRYAALPSGDPDE